MQTIPGISDALLQTSNTKLAAALLVFGFRLRKHPVRWEEEYQWPDVQRWLAGKSTWERLPKKDRCYFLFEADLGIHREIVSSFFSKTADQEFHGFVESMDIPDDQKAKLKMLHSNSCAQVSREVQEKRQYLVDVIKDMPEQNKWVVVRDGDRSASFSKFASKETKIRELSKL